MFIVIIWLIAFVIGFKIHRIATSPNLEIQHARDEVIAHERQDLKDELNMLYSALDILAQSEELERLNGEDTTKPLSESERKTALSTQKEIQSIIKRIHTIENQLSRL